MLINQNIRVGGHRTSIRLEPEFWTALSDVARREGISIEELCTEIDRGTGKLSRTAAVRVFLTTYAVKLSERARKQPRRQSAEDVVGWSEGENVSENSVALQRHRAGG